MSVRVARLLRFCLVTADADRAAAFYARAFDCRRLSTERLAGDARRITLCLGEQTVELLQFDRPGRPYPRIRAASDLIFQHFAIVVRDMAEAYRRLSTLEGWTPISRDGPQQLPASSGGIIAFKFRDPEGHPLELLAFPGDAVPRIWQPNAGTGLFQGIDHSAVSVANTARSISFYESLGFAVTARSLNRGIEQETLDDVKTVGVEVTSLACQQPNPHLELLCYSRTLEDEDPARSDADIASTRLAFSTVGAATSCELVDPDGHRILLEPATG